MVSLEKLGYITKDVGSINHIYEETLRSTDYTAGVSRSQT